MPWSKKFRWDHELGSGSTGLLGSNVFAIAENLKNFGVDQNYVQRFLAAKSDAEAVRSMWIGGLTYIPVSALFFLIGTMLFIYYQAMPNPDLPAKPDQIFHSS